MKVKKIEELDYYELLNIDMDASKEEIEKAYVLGIVTYSHDSLASYGFISSKESKTALERLEEAYNTLIDSDKKRSYDLELREKNPKYQYESYLREASENVEKYYDNEKVKKRANGKLEEMFSFLRGKREEDIEERQEHQMGNPSIMKRNLIYSGEFLKKVRESRNLSLEDVSKATKLRVPLLRALEAEDYESLPKGPYIVFIFKVYAQYLKLNFPAKKMP